MEARFEKVACLTAVWCDHPTLDPESHSSEDADAVGDVPAVAAGPARVDRSVL